MPKLKQIKKSGTLLFLSLCFLVAALQARTKTDVIYLKNGDKITCEIMSMERGRLTIKIDYMIGTHMVDWKEIERIESSQQFQVIWSDGSITTGILRQELEGSQTVGDRRKLIIGIGPADQKRSPDEAIYIDQLGKNFWEQLYIRADAGYSFLKDNDQRQLSINTTVGRLSKLRWTEFGFNSYFTKRSDTDDSTRYEGKFFYFHFLSDAWFAGGQIDMLQSTQQQLDLRTTLSGLGGRLLVRNPSMLVAVVGGLLLNRERFSSEDSTTNSLEAVFGSRINWFHFDSTSIEVSLSAYPGLSANKGRWRFIFDTSLYLDLWGDLYAKFTLFDNYDSEPPSDTPRNDYGGSTTVGWTF